MRLLSTALSALAIGLLVPAGARADGQCTAIHDAAIVTTFVLDHRCLKESPFRLCTEGMIFSGPLAGTTRFTVKTLTSPADAPTTLLYTGVLVITTRSGKVEIQDRGMLDTLTGKFFEFEQVVGGRGRFHEANGMLTSQGVQTMTPPGFSGTVTGFVCTEHTGRSDHSFRDEDSDE
jgi:hypothetical protein